MNILVTGANGFIGKALVRSLLQTSHSVVACVRSSVQPTLECEYRYIDKLDHLTPWQKILKDIDVVVHCVGKAKASKEDLKATNFQDSLNEINTLATLNLAKQAVELGVQKFIFLSSIKVNGEYTLLNLPFTSEINYPPKNPYGPSKYKVELGIKDIALNSPMDFVILRPTVVYGENNIKGNFNSLIKWTNKGIPLPLGGIKNNLRSLVYINNLTDFIITCIDHPNASNEVFLVSDDDDISTAEMLNNIAKGLNVKNRTIAIPPSVIKAFARLINSEQVAQRLCRSLQVDISTSKEKLNWLPKYSTQDSIKKTAQLYKDNLKKANKKLRVQRILDITIASTGLIITSPLLIIITLLTYLDTGSPFFIQKRVGKSKKPFNIVKFRTMKLGTVSVASHLIDSNSITHLGNFLRKTKLDELPQLVNVVKGDMSLVGPRPNLFNQKELIEARDSQGVYEVLPGITGLAQISGIDMSNPILLAKTDKKLIDSFSTKKYFMCLFHTALGKGNIDAIFN